MNILFLALELPYPPNDGGRIRTFNILKQVARRHTVTLLTFGDPDVHGEALGELGRYCREIILIPRPPRVPRTWASKIRDLPRRYPVGLRDYDSVEMRARIRQLVGGGQFDVAHVDQIYLAQYADDLAPLPAVLTHHNVETIAQRRALEARHDRFSPRWWVHWLEHQRWRRFEVDVSRRFGALAVVSQQDAAYFGSHIFGVPIFVVPNGVDTEYFQPSGQPVDQPALLYTGRMNYLPNVDAMRWFCREIWPPIRTAQPQATLTIVGRDPVPEVQALAELPGVTVTGTVPDVRPHFTRAMVYIVPLRLGGGTRLKIPEAMAMGIPIVSTTLGCEGLAISPGEDILIADEAEHFAADVVRLLNDNKTARSALGRRARQTAERLYDWAAIVHEQERAYETAISRGC